jgi:hypothetical protein
MAHDESLLSSFPTKGPLFVDMIGILTIPTHINMSVAFSRDLLSFTSARKRPLFFGNVIL